MKKAVLIFAILALGISFAQAQAPLVPQLINYQGKLTDINGVPLATGNYTLEFNIYTAKTGGTVTWGPLIFDGLTSAGHSAKVPVIEGHFNVFLGPLDTASRPISDAFTADTRFLGISVNGAAELAPRQQILSAPYALQAGYALKAGDAATLGQGKISVDGGGKVIIAAEVESQTGGESFFMVPRGGIIMWSGTLANVPAGWQLCDGTNGTPNLINRFIFSVAGGQNPGETGGSSTHSHPHTHTFDTPASVTSYVGGSKAWGTINGGPATGGHSHSVDPPPGTTGSDSTSASSLPPYYRLAFIMKL